MRTVCLKRGIHDVQLAYAPYAVLLAAFDVTSLLGIGVMGGKNQGDAPSKTAARRPQNLPHVRLGGPRTAAKQMKILDSPKMLRDALTGDRR